MALKQFHLAEEDMNFDSMTATAEHPIEFDDESIDTFADPLVQLLAREEMATRAALMTARREPHSIGQMRRSKV